METTRSVSTWTETNQAHLVAEFARLKLRLRPGVSSQPSAEPAAESSGTESPPAIDWLSELFGLSQFEREILLLCAGVELDSSIAELCGQAHGSPQRTYATFGLALGALSEPHWSALTPARPLRRFRMVELATGQGLTAAPLRIDERILHYLTGVNLLDPRLQPMLQPLALASEVAQSHKLVVDRIVHIVQTCSDGFPLLHLCGDDAHGQEDTAAAAAHLIGRHLLVLRAEDIPSAGPDLDQFVPLWERETLLLPGALLIQCGSEGLIPTARRLTEMLPGVVFLASREPLRLNRSFLRFEVNKPAPTEQKRLWQEALGSNAAGLNGTLDAVSHHFILSGRTILSTGSVLRSESGSLKEDLWNACRSLARPRLDDLAQRILPTAKWDDLILPEQQKQTLRQIASHVGYRMKVYETWGFAAKDRRGLGISALFAGESGTGKTMAAEVLANELNLDLYRIDLSAVVSKYIGETEKNLKQVFDAAEEGGAVLLFDEADALFGKRSDVKDSHDRYANIEVSYLLQRIESYQGLAILTTNLKSTIDRAFQRRLRFTVNFPFPDATQREAIWKQIFPPKTPISTLDYKRLAQLNVAGGNIRNIALNAAFLAAEEGDERSLGMEHLFRAAMLEAQKIERPLSPVEVKGWI